MGHGHAISGAAAGVAITSSAAGALGLVPMEPSGVASLAIVAAGAALLLDADHHSGTIAHSLPPLSKIVTRFVGQISGGHRHATHSLVGVAISGALAYLLSLVRVTVAGREIQLGAWLLIVLMVAFAAKATKITRGWLSSWTVSVTLATLAVWFAPMDLWWLPLAVTLGCAMHLLGDMLTVQGVPLLWPLNPKPPKVITGVQKLVVLAPLWAISAGVVALLIQAEGGAEAARQNTPLLILCAGIIVSMIAVTLYGLLSGAFERGTIWRKNGYFSIPILGTAGSGREWLLTVAMTGYTVWILLGTFAPTVTGAILDAH